MTYRYQFQVQLKLTDMSILQIRVNGNPELLNQNRDKIRKTSMSRQVCVGFAIIFFLSIFAADKRPQDELRIP